MAAVRALCDRRFLRSTASFLPLLRSNSLRNLNGMFPPSAIKQESTRAGDGNRQRQDFKLPDPRSIYVGNIGQTTEDGLFKYFSKYGEIEKVIVNRTWMSGLSREFAFVTFCNPESAMLVLDEAHVVDGSDITVGRALRGCTTKEQVQGENQRIVLVTNILKSTTKEMIKNHFSQFGKIENAILAQKGEKDDDLDSYYIVFSSLSAVKRSLEEPTHVIAEQGINSKAIKVSKMEKTVEKSTRLLVLHIPDEITVGDLRDYFQNFGDVENVELFLDSSLYAKGLNVAFVNFQSEFDLDKLVKNKIHSINGLQVEVEKPKNLNVTQRPGKMKFSVVGIPQSARRNDVEKFLRDGMGIMAHIRFFRRNVAQSGKSLCVVELMNQGDLAMVLSPKDVKFRGVPVHFRQLVWRKEGQEQK